MNGLPQGGIRIFRIAGINVFLHWSWFLIALYEINARTRSYSAFYWNVLEYLALFAIVLTHEFGHALACRQVGGDANQIVLWPFGGVAYVNPPQRPGATLWSIVAGPLVNVALVPILGGLFSYANYAGWETTNADLFTFLYWVRWINYALLFFNILPIYPLDGGKILRSLLWFVMGRAHSLMVATIIGFVGMIGFIALAFVRQDAWLGILAVFLLLNCWSGLQQARALLRMSKLPRHQGFECPSCKTAPPVGNFWVCPNCRKPFDTFQSHAVCPNCSTRFSVTRCLDCGRSNPMNQWIPYIPARPLG